MSLDQILSELRSYEGVLELAPEAGSNHPEISWGDYFFYYAPDGEVPRNRQPYATIITKNYPDDTQSQLDGKERWRLNIHVGSQRFAALLGYPPESIQDRTVDFSQTDTFLPHPLYGANGWVSVVNPGPSTTSRTLTALHQAHLADQRRVERRSKQIPRDSSHG